MRADILLLRMKMFKNISVEMKKELFLATLKNDLRWDEDKQLKEYMDNNSGFNQWSSLQAQRKSSRFSGLFWWILLYFKTPCIML